jgi:hypothetical protein
MMTRKLVILIGTLVLGLSLVGASSAQSAPAKKIKLRMATGKVAWGMYTRAIKLAEILNRHANMSVTVESTAGTPALLSAVTNEIADIGGPNEIGTTTENYTGKLRWKGKPSKNIRGLIALGFIYYTYIARPGSGITSIADLKGQTVPTYTASSWGFFNEVLKEYGIDPAKDLNQVERAGNAAAQEDLIMGRFNAAQESANVRALLPIQEAWGKIVWLPMEADKVLAAKAKNPELMRPRYPVNITPEFMKSIKMPGPVPGIATPNMLITNTKLSFDVAYTIVKTMLDQHKEYKKTVIDFSPAVAAVVPAFPFHPGAVKAFQEAGLWTDEMDKAQKALLASE